MPPSLLLYLESMLLGLSVAAPIGPINVEIIRRGLTRSSREAFAMGCGAVTADCIYFSLALTGAQLVTSMGESRAARTMGLAIGASMLIWLGIGAIRKIRRIVPTPALVDEQAIPAVKAEPGHPVSKTYALGVALTLANPMTIALWLSIAAGFAASAVSPEAGSGAASGTEFTAPLLRLGGVFSGAISWVCFVTGLTAWARRWINPTLMQTVNLISGLILIGYGVRFALKIFGVG